MFRAMTMDFHRNHYTSHRGPNEVSVSTRIPRDLRTELLALCVAMEEPRHSVLLRIIEEYVDAHQAEVEEGMRRIARSCRPDGWDERLGGECRGRRHGPGHVGGHLRSRVACRRDGLKKGRETRGRHVQKGGRVMTCKREPFCHIIESFCTR